MKLEFQDSSPKERGEKAQQSTFNKIRPVGTELFHANGRTDMTKLVVASRNFANASKKTDTPRFALFRKAPGVFYYGTSRSHYS
jgi:hypothetical protein